MEIKLTNGLTADRPPVIEMLTQAKNRAWPGDVKIKYIYLNVHESFELVDFIEKLTSGWKEFFFSSKTAPSNYDDLQVFGIDIKLHRVIRQLHQDGMLRYFVDVRGMDLTEKFLILHPDATDKDNIEIMMSWCDMYLIDPCQGREEYIECHDNVKFDGRGWKFVNRNYDSIKYPGEK